jgi:hypothetical protein
VGRLLVELADAPKGKPVRTGLHPCDVQVIRPAPCIDEVVCVGLAVRCCDGRCADTRDRQSVVIADGNGSIHKQISEEGDASRMKLVQLGGLEPPTSCSTDRRSNQLSYNCIPIAPQKSGHDLAGN